MADTRPQRGEMIGLRGQVGRRRLLVLALAAALAAWIAHASAFRPPPASDGFGPAANPWAMTLVPEAGRLFVLGRTRIGSIERHSDILSVLDSQTGALITSRYLSPNDVTTGDDPDRPPIDTHTGRVLLNYVDKVEEYDARSGQLIRTDPPGFVPEATDARTGHLFVSSYVVSSYSSANCEDLIMLDAATRAVIKRIPLGRTRRCLDFPAPFADTPARTLYVLLPRQRTILLLDPGSGHVRRTLTLPMQPAQAVLVGESGRIALAVEHGGSSCDHNICTYDDGTHAPADGSTRSALLLLDGATGRTLHRVDIQGAPFQILSDARRERLYVLTTGYISSAEVSWVNIINAANGTLLSSTVMIGRVPAGMTIDDLTGRLLVPGLAPPATPSDGSAPDSVVPPAFPTPDRISVFDPTGGLRGTLPAGGREPQAHAVDRATGRVYVANLCAAQNTPALQPREDWLHHLLPFLPSASGELIPADQCPPTGLVLIPASRL